MSVQAPMAAPLWLAERRVAHAFERLTARRQALARTAELAGYLGPREARDAHLAAWWRLRAVARGLPDIRDLTFGPWMGLVVGLTTLSYPLAEETLSTLEGLLLRETVLPFVVERIEPRTTGVTVFADGAWARWIPSKRAAIVVREVLRIVGEPGKPNK
jgi:hypothetical protein